MRTPRTLARLAAATVVVVVLAGCSAAASPSPAPTAAPSATADGARVSVDPKGAEAYVHADCVVPASGDWLYVDGGISCPGLDLSGRAVAISAGVNVSGGNFSFTDFTGSELMDVNLTGANLRAANLTSVPVAGSNFSGADLRDANLSDGGGWDQAITDAGTKYCKTVMPNGKLNNKGC